MDILAELRHASERIRAPKTMAVALTPLIAIALTLTCRLHDDLQYVELRIHRHGEGPTTPAPANESIF